MQELTLEAEVAGDPVDGVAADGQVDRLEVHADLMRAARLEAHVEQRPLAELLPHLEPGDGVARRLGVEGVPRPIAPVATDRRLDPPGARARCSADERDVAPLDPPLANRRRKPRVRLVRARHDEQARTCRGRAGGRSRAGRDRRRPRRARGARARAFRSGARRPDGRRRPRACRRRAGARPRSTTSSGTSSGVSSRGRRQLDLELLPTFEPVALLARSVRRRARPRPQRDARRGSAFRPRESRRRRRRGADPRRTQERESGDVPTRALDRSAATNERNSRPTPTTMNVSARLNAGQ